MSIESALASDEENIPLRFTVPEQFHELDLTESPESRMDRTFVRFRSTLPGITDEQCMHLVANQETALDDLIGHGAVYAAVLAARSDANPQQLSFAQFSILVKTMELPGRRPAATLVGGLKAEGRQVSLVEFPAGQAVVVGEETTVSRPITVTGQQVEHAHRVRQAQVIFCRQGHSKLVTLNLSTESLGDWDTYATLLNGIARSVSFREQTENSIMDRLTA